MKTTSIRNLMIKHLKKIIKVTHNYRGDKELQFEKINSLINMPDPEFLKEYNNLLKLFHTWR